MASEKPPDDVDVDALRRELAELRRELDGVREQARIAVEARDAFFDAAAHDLRTPLHVLTLQLSALVLGPSAQLVPEALRARVAAMDLQVQHLVRLTDRLVDASMLVNGKLPLHRAPLDLVTVAHAAVRRLGDTLKWARCDVTLDTPASMFVHADAVRIDEVVGNLLVNAAKYAPGGPISVVVDGADRYARITIADRGPGVPAHLRDRIFQKFERGESPDGTSGLGLGLWIARQIVEAHGGTIVVEDAPQGGASFVVALPSARRAGVSES